MAVYVPKVTFPCSMDTPHSELKYIYKNGNFIRKSKLFNIQSIKTTVEKWFSDWKLLRDIEAPPP